MVWIRWFGQLLLLMFLATASGLALCASVAEPRFESVGADVIPRGVVASLAQDRAGFIWVGTGDGLVRYDGYRFRPQERASKTATARNLGWLRALLPARDGRLWIGTETDGLAVYDPLTEQVSSYCFESGGALASDPPKAALATITALAEDIDGAIWVGTLGGGLHRFDPVSKTFRHFRQANGLADDRVQALMVDKQGTLWVGTWAGLSRRVKGTDRFESLRLGSVGPGSRASEQVVQTLFQASDGRVWLGTDRGAVAVLDADTGMGGWLPKTPAGRSAPGRDQQHGRELGRALVVGARGRH